MKKLTLAAMAVACGFALGACSAPKKAGEPPRQAVERLIKLYQEDRARFVRNMQKYEQEKDNCSHVEQVKKEAEQMEFDGAVPKEQDRTLKVVMMELQQAEKKCRE